MLPPRTSSRSRNYALAIKQADEGKFKEASDSLFAAKEGAESLLPAGGSDARNHAAAWAEFKPRLLAALSLKSDCTKVKGLQAEIASLVDQVEKQATAGEFGKARAAMDAAGNQAQVAQFCAASFSGYVQNKAAAGTTLAAAGKLKAADKSQEALQSQLDQALKGARGVRP